MKIKLLNNLNFRLSATILSITFLISIIFITFFSRELNNRLYSDFIHHKSNLVKLLNRDLSADWSENNIAKITATIGFLKSDEDFSFAAVYNSGDSLLASSLHGRQNCPVIYKEDFARETNLIIEDKIISEDGSYHGRLIAGFDKTTIATDISSEILKFNIFVLLLATAIFLGIKLVIRKAVLKPLKRLNNLTSTLADGNFDAQISHSGDDEIGQLASSFNRMSSHLKNYFESISLSKKEVEKMEKFYTAIIDYSPNLILIINNQNEIAVCNEAARKCFNLQKSSHLQPLADAHDKFRELLPLIRENITPEKDTFNFNCEFFQLHGQNTAFKIIVYALPDNELASTVILMVDITEQLSLQEQLGHAQKMEAIGTLSGGIAHDFNNVLSGIIGTMSLLKFKLKDRQQINWSELEYYTGIIDNSADRAKDMVQQILNLSRREERSRAPVNLNNILSNLKHICSNSLDKSIELHFTPYPESAGVLADFTRIEQVLLNLCVNSAHAMTFMRGNDEIQGGILSVSVSRFHGDSYFRSVHPEAELIDYWLIKVQDNGIGIDRQNMQKIFEPFFTTKKREQGTGLGLSMAYNIIRDHRGLIRVYSEPGIGTSFHIYLPVVEGDSTTQIQESSTTVFKGTGTILVVDDEKIMRDLTRDILETCGYEVILTENGEEAINIFSRKHYLISLTLLDLVMPKKSGRETFNQMKKIKPDAKVLILSGFNQDERIEELLNNGANGFLEKPYTLHTLSKVVHDLLISE